MNLVERCPILVRFAVRYDDFVVMDDSARERRLQRFEVAGSDGWVADDNGTPRGVRGKAFTNARKQFAADVDRVAALTERNRQYPHRCHAPAAARSCCSSRCASR